MTTKLNLFLITRDVPVTGHPEAFWAVSARDAADQFAAAHAWSGDMLVQQVLGAQKARMDKEQPLWMKAR